MCKTSYINSLVYGFYCSVSSKILNQLKATDLLNIFCEYVPHFTKVFETWTPGRSSKENVQEPRSTQAALSMIERGFFLTQPCLFIFIFFLVKSI